MLLALGVSLALHFSPSVANAPPLTKPAAAGSFVKDRALARLLGETDFEKMAADSLAETTLSLT